MNKLIKLELYRNSLRVYTISSAISLCVMIGFTYLIAFIPRIESNEQDAELFTEYHFIIGLSCIVCMGIFSIMSGVIASKIIIEEYKGKRAALLLSYPCKRDKIFTAKVILSFLYTVISMFICEGITLTLFLFTSALFKICPDTMSAEIIIYSLVFLLCSSVAAGTIGIISMRIGFIKKSVPTTIVSAFIAVSLVCQLMAQTLTFSSDSYFINIIFTAIMAAAAFAMYKNLCRKINVMEV